MENLIVIVLTFFVANTYVYYAHEHKIPKLKASFIGAGIGFCMSSFILIVSFFLGFWSIDLVLSFTAFIPVLLVMLMGITSGFFCWHNYGKYEIAEENRNDGAWK